MMPAMLAAERIWSDLGQECVITSVMDGTHRPGSRHYIGLAVDFRIRYFDYETQQIARERLRESLGKDYDVILEPTHIHCEFDPKLS